HDQELDQRETAIVAPEALPQIGCHSMLLRLVELRWLGNRSACDCSRHDTRTGDETTKGAVSRALRVLTRTPADSAVTGLDVARGAGLVVLNRARNRVADAVPSDRGNRDLDVLDPGVVGRLQLRQGHARVAGGVVGVERLHARNGSADVRLRGGLVRPRAEAEV